MLRLRLAIAPLAVAAASFGATLAGAQAPGQDLCAAFAGKRYLTQADLTNKDGSYIAAGVVDFKTKMVHGFWAHKTPSTKAEGGSYAFTCTTVKDKSGTPAAGLVTSNQGQILLYPARGGAGLPRIVNGNGLFANVPVRVFDLK